MVRKVDLVADIGESFGAWHMGDDEALIELLTSANVACGFHAGDPQTMERTVRECARRGVGVGVHPSFPDLVGFGRRDMGVTPRELHADVLYQTGALHAFAVAAGTRLTHLAPHGRLANVLVHRTDLAEAVAQAVQSFDPSIIVLAQEGEMTTVAERHGLSVGYLGLADRAYQADGTLVPRSEPGAVIHDEDEVAGRTVRMVIEGVVRAVTGDDVPVRCDTVLLHGDGPNALALARRIRSGLVSAGVEFAPLTTVLATRTGT